MLARARRELIGEQSDGSDLILQGGRGRQFRLENFAFAAFEFANGVCGDAVIHFHAGSVVSRFHRLRRVSMASCSCTPMVDTLVFRISAISL